MKCTIPEISWHNRDPVLSVDIQPKYSENEDFRRLATGGTDSHVLIWHIQLQENGAAVVEFAADLTRHQRAVNVVRFSPSGEFLASGDDESAIIVWKQRTDLDCHEFPGGNTETEGAKEQWLSVKVLRGHIDDVYDLCWSPDSRGLVSGSVDNEAILWDVAKGNKMAALSDHKGFVQGVTWDPKNQLVATLCSDRKCRVFSVRSKKVVSRSSRSLLPVSEDSPLYGVQLHLYHDDTFKSFFRRLCFSPDGNLLFTPSGFIEEAGANVSCYATYVYSRKNLSRPCAYFPSNSEYTIAVRCCPVIYELRECLPGSPPVFDLPYRMVIAVAEQKSVVLYDTQQNEPFAVISNIHYTRLTDLTWSSDGRLLIISSTDGYCSIVSFAEGELGVVYVPKTGDQDPKTGGQEQFFTPSKGLFKDAGKSPAATPATDKKTKKKKVLAPKPVEEDEDSLGVEIIEVVRETSDGGVGVKRDVEGKKDIADAKRDITEVKRDSVTSENLTKPVRRIKPLLVSSTANNNQAACGDDSRSEVSLGRASDVEAKAAKLSVEAISAEPSVESMTAKPSVEAMSAEPSAESMSADPSVETKSAETSVGVMSAEPSVEAMFTDPSGEAMSVAPSVESMSVEPSVEAMSTDPSGETMSVAPSVESMSVEPSAEAKSADPSERAKSAGPCVGVVRESVNESKPTIAEPVMTTEVRATLEGSGEHGERKTSSTEAMEVSAMEPAKSRDETRHREEADESCPMEVDEAEITTITQQRSPRADKEGARTTEARSVRGTEAMPAGEEKPTPTTPSQVSPVKTIEITTPVTPLTPREERRTPRRVGLITISSPKSKKNLLG